MSIIVSQSGIIINVERGLKVKDLVEILKQFDDNASVLLLAPGEVYEEVDVERIEYSKYNLGPNRVVIR